MAKLLKVSNAICPYCQSHRPLDDDGSYQTHLNYGEKLYDGTRVNTVCEGTGLKASRMALRMERKRIRNLVAIERRHAERQKLKTELAPEVEKLQSHRSINAQAFCGLLKAYGLWDSIPARRKNTIKDRLKCLQYDGCSINIILHGKGNSKGILPLAKELLSVLTRGLL